MAPAELSKAIAPRLGESLPTAQSPLTEPNFSANLPQDTVWRRRQDRVAPGSLMHLCVCAMPEI